MSVDSGANNLAKVQILSTFQIYISVIDETNQTIRACGDASREKKDTNINREDNDDDSQLVKRRCGNSCLVIAAQQCR